MRKDPFRMLGKAKEKKAEKFESLDAVVLKDGLVRIPASAFERLSSHAGFEYLKSGLYVPSEMLRTSDKVFEMTGDILEKPSSTDDYDKKVFGTTWFKAKTAAKRLGGRLLTLPEYVCAVNWAYDKNKKLYTELALTDNEWLDGMIEPQIGKEPDPGALFLPPFKREYYNLMHSDVVHDTANGEVKIQGQSAEKIPLMFYQDYMDFLSGKYSTKDMSFPSGFPTAPCEGCWDIEYSFYFNKADSFNAKHAIFRSSEWIHEYMMIPKVSWAYPDQPLAKCGLRVCYSENDLKELKRKGETR